MPIDNLEQHDLMLLFYLNSKCSFYDRKMQLYCILLLDGSHLLGNGRVYRQV